jgi:hypothetical protein
MVDIATGQVPDIIEDGKDAAKVFISDLAKRLANRVQLTSDGHGPYLAAVDRLLRRRHRLRHAREALRRAGRCHRSLRPGDCVGTEQRRVEGRPDPAHVSTSFVERANLTIRMGARRFTRLTNAFSKKTANHEHSVAIHTMHYNFVRIHQTLRCTPAMAAGVTTKLWELSDMVRVLEDWEGRVGQSIAA